MVGEGGRIGSVVGVDEEGMAGNEVDEGKKTGDEVDEVEVVEHVDGTEPIHSLSLGGDEWRLRI